MPTTRYVLLFPPTSNCHCTDRPQWGGATYDEVTGWCTQANSDARIAGKEWEAACRDIAQKGFGCIDGQGKCYADVGDVRGRC